MAYNAEAKIQAAIVSWVRTVAPQCMVFSVPNGAHVARSIDDAAKAFEAWRISTREAPPPRQATFPQFERDAGQSHG